MDAHNFSLSRFAGNSAETSETSAPLLNGKDGKQTFDPNRLLDFVSQKLATKNDHALACLLEVSPAMISKIRHQKYQVGAGLLVRMHELTGDSVLSLRLIMGDRRKHVRHITRGVRSGGLEGAQPGQPDQASRPSICQRLPATREIAGTYITRREQSPSFAIDTRPKTTLSFEGALYPGTQTFLWHSFRIVENAFFKLPARFF